MPNYLFHCDKCDMPLEVYRTMASAGEALFCPNCSMMARRIYGANVFSFKPYVEERINGQPIELTSASHRDRVLAEHGLSGAYDSYQFFRPKRTSVMDGITLDTVVEAMNNGTVKEADDGGEVAGPGGTGEEAEGPVSDYRTATS